MIKIYDDALSEDMFVSIYNKIADWSFPWYWTNSAYHGNTDDINAYSWSHLVYNYGNRLSSISQDLEQAIQIATSTNNIPFSDLHRIRIGLQTPVSTKTINEAHVDFPAKHIGAILYLNDSDGDTYFYEQEYIPISGMLPKDFYYGHLKGNVTIKQRVTPKRNRLVVFNGLRYHSSSTPETVARRMIVNYNWGVDPNVNLFKYNNRLATQQMR